MKALDRYPARLAAAAWLLVAGAAFFCSCSSGDNGGPNISLPSNPSGNQSSNCVPSGGSCTSGDQCCGGVGCNTDAHTCQPGSCLIGDLGCTSNAQCCSGSCVTAADHPTANLCHP